MIMIRPNQYHCQNALVKIALVFLLHHMENILLLTDAGKPDIDALDFGCFIANLTHSNLKLYFLQEFIGEERPALKQLFGMPYVESIYAADFPENKEKRNLYKENERIFGEFCRNRGVNFQVHHQKQPTVQQIIKESRYADLIIINPETSLGAKLQGTPSPFVKEILAASECPVIVSSFDFEGIDEILFTHDGSKSSVFAIKQFMHLLPQLNNKKITVLEIMEDGHDVHNERDQFLNLLTSHYQEIGLVRLQGRASDTLFDHLLGKKNLLVVMGAFGRGMLSNLFKASVADLVVKTINLPVFIAHQ
jgi:hypothetical protein